MDCEQKEEQNGAISPANLSTLVADNNKQENLAAPQDQEECCSNISARSPISSEIVSVWLSLTTVGAVIMAPLLFDDSKNKFEVGSCLWSQ